MTATAVRERPILFSGEMVRAVLEGRKNQTRRVVANPDHYACLTGDCPHWSQKLCDAHLEQECPHGRRGDRLWVRESFIRHISILQLVGYVADGCEVTEHWERKAPSIHMPRKFCRLSLEITDVRAEPLQEISYGDVLSEGCPLPGPVASSEDFDWFRGLWDRINGPRGFGWDSNPWVWVIGFRLLEVRS